MFLHYRVNYAVEACGPEVRNDAVFGSSIEGGRDGKGNKKGDRKKMIQYRLGLGRPV